MKKPSIEDIAGKVGVSKSLVSFVLSGKGREHRISPKTIKKVLKVARELNYKPNQIARWFRTGKTQMIGLIIADISNPFFGKLGREIESEAERMGYRVILCSSDESYEKSGKQLEMLLKSHVDGLIIAPPQGSINQIKELFKSNVPFVLVDRYFPEIDSDYVVIDNFDAGYNMTNHLLDKGYRNIAFITVNDKLITMHSRAEGYLKALKDKGIKVDEDMVINLPFSHDKKDLREVIGNLIRKDRKIDAVFFSSSKIGLMGLEIFSEMGIRIPDDLAVVSFDDPEFFKVCYSPITAIEQPLEKMGKRSVRILVDQINSGISGSTGMKIVLKSKLIIRKSSGY